MHLSNKYQCERVAITGLHFRSYKLRQWEDNMDFKPEFPNNSLSVFKIFIFFKVTYYETNF